MTLENTKSKQQDRKRITFGRTMVNGKPIDDGLTLSIDSPTVKMLAKAKSPLLSNPMLGEYGAGIVLAEETGGQYMQALGITPPGAAGPPRHFHPKYDEHFEVIEGEFIFEIEKKRIVLQEGENIKVKSGTVHTFRNESDNYASFVIEAKPAGRLTDVIHLLWGLGHDNKLTRSGEPKFLQAMVTAKEMGDDTVFASPPVPIQKFMVGFLAPIGHLMGYKGTYSKYEEDAFWESRVEQPDLSFL